MVRARHGHTKHCTQAAQTTPSNHPYATDAGWITPRALCKDERMKICAWTSARKTVLTAASGAPHLSCNPKTDMMDGRVPGESAKEVGT